jgi:hypothetical protein
MTPSQPRAPRRLPPDRIDDRWQVAPRRPDGTRGQLGTHIGPIRVTPTRTIFIVALAGSILYLLYAITVRDASQIPLLASGAAVLGIVFAALAVSGGYGTIRSGQEGEAGRSILLAVGGGIAGMIAAGCFAVAVVLALAYRG